MIEVLLKKYQGKRPFGKRIYNFQKRKGDPNPEHVHIELRFIGPQFGDRNGMMFSSSGRGGFLGKGVRFIDGTIDPEKWDIFPL